MKLEEIKAREKAATPGPMFIHEVTEDLSSGKPVEEYWWHTKGFKWDSSLITHKGDAEFYAHAREDIPALIAEVERLQKENLSFHA